MKVQPKKLMYFGNRINVSEKLPTKSLFDIVLGKSHHCGIFTK